MQFGIFYEHQLPRPWQEDSEVRLIHEALAQVELADRLGIDYAWEVEHHFLEEYSHSSAPEVFLAACAARTERIRLGHGIVLMPPGYNHPARVAERIAMLDLVSRGRVEFGTGESASRMELEGFGVPPTEKRAMWREAVAQVALMLSESPYPGYDGKYFKMPPRNVLPKPVQKPHPPMWLACSSRPMIHLAAQLGLGALTFAFVDVSEAKHWVADYYDTFKRECTPIAQAVVAQPVFIQQGGNNRHEDICASLELFAARVMPEFKERHAARERRKAEELAPHVERALARRTPPREPGELPLVQAYGRDLVSGTGQYPTADRR